eukprot:4901152-Prymnesium_polylepis.1
MLEYLVWRSALAAGASTQRSVGFGGGEMRVVSEANGGAHARTRSRSHSAGPCHRSASPASPRRRGVARARAALR